MKNSILTLIPYFIAAPLVIVVMVVTLLSFKGKAPAMEEAQAAPVAEEAHPEVVKPAEEIKIQTEVPTEELAQEITNVPVSVNEVPDTGDKSDWHFYNNDLQDNGEAKDDYNFGPNPLVSDAFNAKVMEAIKAKNYQGTINVDDLFKDVDASGLDQEFRKRLREDPALGAADMAWFDSIVGTRYLGTFYSEAKNQWDVAMNDAKDRWRADGAEYAKTLDAFERYLNSATKVEIRRATGLTDQMYMNPFTVEEGVPDVIVMESADHSGWFLVYTFTIKETATKEVMYRLDCGYQPTNVAKVMKVTAKKNPTVKGGGISGGGKSGAIAGGGVKTTTITGGGKTTRTPPKPTPPPDPTPPGPKYNKDPSKGTPVLPNDDSGPGENTNTGKDSQYSSKDQVGNSNDLTPSEYKETINEMKEANSDNGGGGDGSTPSTDPPSSDTHEDNPGGSDDGHTETSDSSVADDDAGDSWDGPPD